MQQSSDGGWTESTRWDVICLLLLTIAVFLLFETSPRAGDFWWSDAPRHAMDGVFYHDLIRALPITNLKQWATDYYLQYPAVTVLFYPPLFALVEAVFFSLFGVSHAVAQLTVSAFFLATAYGAYFLTRRWVGRVAAFSTTLLFVGTPCMALWGRQVVRFILNGRFRDRGDVHQAATNVYRPRFSAYALPRFSKRFISPRGVLVVDCTLADRCDTVSGIHVVVGPT